MLHILLQWHQQWSTSLLSSQIIQISHIYCLRVLILIPFVTKWSKKYNIVFVGNILMFHLKKNSKIKN